MTREGEDEDARPILEKMTETALPPVTSKARLLLWDVSCSALNPGASVCMIASKKEPWCGHSFREHGADQVPRVR